MKSTRDLRVTIIGAGNIGSAIARGLAQAGRFRPDDMTLTRRRVERLAELEQQGFVVTADNVAAVERASFVIVAVEPGQLDGVLAEIGPALDPEQQVLISVVSGARVDDILHQVSRAGSGAKADKVLAELQVVRAMPNTAIALGQSMTCLATNSTRKEVVELTRSIFDAVGKTVVINEELMVPATALCACGVAFFLRSVRAASQGGIEIGFHPDDAVAMAAQTALGAAALVLEGESHPEREIDAVTTPRGCTISGLNEMEHRGFSSAMIKGIVTSAEKADRLYAPPRDDE